jgi:lysophospholipase L1-like esterase
MKNTLIVVAIIIVTLLLAEGAARVILWAPPVETNVGTPRQGLTADAVGDWVPNQNGIWQNGRLEFPFHVHINGAGFRNLEELDLAAFKVLVLGDSQTFGLFVGSNDIWTNVAEKILNAGAARKVQLLNNGIPGSTVSDHLAYLNEKGARLSPDMVLLVVNSNDVSDLRRDETSIGSLRSAWMESHDQVSFQALRWFLQHGSALYVLARKAKETSLFKRHQAEAETLGVGARLENGAQGPVQAGPTVGAQNFARYEGLLDQTIAKAKALGARLVLCYLGTPWDSDTGALPAILRRQSETHGVPMIDVTPAFDGTRIEAATWYRDRRIDPNYVGDGHFNRMGHLVIGEYLAARMRPIFAEAIK